MTHLLFQKRNQRWRAAQRAYGAVLPQAVVDDLVNRDISENDYDLLMQLDRYGCTPWKKMCIQRKYIKRNSTDCSAFFVLTR